MEEKVVMTSTGAQLSLEAFDAKATTWNRWVKRLETALKIAGAAEANKRDYLLHYMGAKAYNTLCDKVFVNHKLT